MTSGLGSHPLSEGAVEKVQIGRFPDVGQAFQPAIHAASRGGRLESLPHKEAFSTGS